MSYNFKARKKQLYAKMTVYIEVEVYSNCVKRAPVESFIRQHLKAQRQI